MNPTIDVIERACSPDRAMDDRVHLGTGWVPGFPVIPLRKVRSRHFVTRATPNDAGRSDQRNTMIAPWVNVRADIEAINRGEGFLVENTTRVWINGRVYGMKTRVGNGVCFPVSGPGFFNVSSGDHAAFRTFISYNGDVSAALRELMQNPRISDEHVAVGQRLWEIRDEWDQRSDQD